MVTPERIHRKKTIFLPYVQIKYCGVKHKSGKNFSSQNRNNVTRLSRSSLLMVVSNLVMFLDTEEWLPQAQVCLRWSAVTWPMNFVVL